MGRGAEDSAPDQHPLLVAEHFVLGYLATGIFFGMIIGFVTMGYFLLELDGIWAF